MSLPPRPAGGDRSGAWARATGAPVHDAATGPSWQSLLDAGRVEWDTSVDVAEALVAAHAATAGRAELAAAFAGDEEFERAQLRPSLLAVAEARPEVADRLRELARVTLSHKSTLVHGGLSARTILIGPDAPSFAPPVCPWYGDPAYDLASCLAPLLREAARQPRRYAACLSCFEALAETYVDGVSWEDAAGIEARTAHLLPGLLLEHAGAVPLLLEPPASIEDVRAHWREIVAP